LKTDIILNMEKVIFMKKKKRGSSVKINRDESFWHNEIGKIVSIEESPEILYNFTVRFEKPNYYGINTANFCSTEIIDIE